MTCTPRQTSSIPRFLRRTVVQKGSVNLSMLLLVLGLVGYGGYKFGLPIFNYHQLKKDVGRIAVFSTAGVLSETKYSVGQGPTTKETIQESVLKQAQQIGIPLTRQNVRVAKGQGTVLIAVQYSVPVDLPTGVYNLKFNFMEGN